MPVSLGVIGLGHKVQLFAIGFGVEQFARHARRRELIGFAVHKQDRRGDGRDIATG